MSESKSIADYYLTVSMLKEKKESSEGYKVKFYVLDKNVGNTFKGSLMYKSRPSMGKVYRFIYEDILHIQQSSLRLC